ncbi:transposase [Streptomyces sp. NPDC002545]
MATARHLASDLHRAPGPGRRERTDHLRHQRRLHRVPGPPARRRGEEKGELQKEPPGGVTVEPDDHGLGRSRGGLTTKLHLAVEQGQKPMSIVITAGQRGDSPQFEPVLNKIRVPRLGSGRPRTRPNRVRADKTCASRKNRAYLRRRDPLHHPGQGRPGPQPQETRFARRPAAEVRPTGLQSSTRSRMRHQWPQKPPGCGREV